MQSLKITMIDGKEYVCQITPFLEVEFETYHRGGYRKIFREEEKQTDLYWLAHACLKQVRPPVEPTVPVFGDDFLKSLKVVEVIPEEADSPNG